MFSKLRARLGLDRCRFLVSGGAPLAAEIAEFFHAVGLLILEGYGLTETMAAAYLNTLTRYRFGTVGPALDVVETQDRRRRRDPHARPVGVPAVLQQRRRDGRGRAARRLVPLGRHRPPRGRLPAHHRSQEGPHRHGQRQEGGAAAARERAQGALAAREPGRRLRRQALVLRRARHAVRGGAQEVTPADGNVGRNAAHRDVGAELKAALQKDVDALNATLAPYETIKKFTVLADDFTEAAGEVTPSLKIKRKVVVDKYRAVIDSMYQGPPSD